MDRLKRIKYLCLCASIALAAPATAQDGNPHQAFVDAFASRERMMVAFTDNAEQSMIEESRRDPELVEMEAECPGALKLMASASMPVMTKSHGRAVDTYRAGLLALVSERMTAEQAAQAAEFYASEDGRFMIALAEESEVATRSLADIRANEDSSISREAYDADKAAQREALRNSEHRERIAEVGMKLAASDWFITFLGMREQMHALQFALNNDDFTPEEDAALEHVVEKAMTGHFESCYAE